MAKRAWVCWGIIGLVLSACSYSKKECGICGSFELVNFNKNEINYAQNGSVNIRRNLTLDATKGLDYFAVWKWDQQRPDSSWSESFQKSVEIKYSRLEVNENGTWEWLINVHETFATSAFFGESGYEIKKAYSERGFWQFMPGNAEIIEFEIRENEVINNIAIIDPKNKQQVWRYLPQRNEKKQFNHPHKRRFEINGQTTNGLLVLKTVDDDSNIYPLEIENGSYGLVQGNVFLTLNTLNNRAKLAVKYP